MKPFETHTGIIAPLDRVNVDTDAIIPKQFLRKVDKIGFGKHLFHEWRYTDIDGKVENPEFILNKGVFRKATVLLARANFGCGSSREHAPWALEDFGFRVIVAPSFAEIFYNNCFKNGILPVILTAKEVDELFVQVLASPGVELKADLVAQKINGPKNQTYSFSINSFAKECLLKGLDSIGWTQQFNDKIAAYEKTKSAEKPWLFARK
ncbi:MAG: 3-isopropylmalate dehydratase small subunit [Candidatus Omnitrophota bacterium]